MIILTYKNPIEEKKPFEPSILTAGSMLAGMNLSESNLLERATFHQKINSFLLCLFGLTKDVEENPITRQTIYRTMVRRRLPHLVGFTLLVNALLFQSMAIYAIIINRDHSHAS